MRSIITALVLLLAALSYLLWTNQQALQLARLTNLDLEKKLADKSQREAFELSKECSAKAMLTFRSLGYKENGRGLDNAQAQSHFDPARQKCFMTIESRSFSNNGVFITRLVFDAFENRQYGELNSILSMGDLGTERLMTCRMISGVGDEKNCHSVAEYDAFVAGFMQEAK